jgi:lactate dehydrogenase-like 2-hydroxyacid dehydrogenase
LLTAEADRELHRIAEVTRNQEERNFSSAELATCIGDYDAILTVRHLDNVVLTPHIAGASRQARIRQGNFMVDEIRRFFANEPLLFQVTAEMLDSMA